MRELRPRGILYSDQVAIARDARTADGRPHDDAPMARPEDEVRRRARVGRLQVRVELHGDGNAVLVTASLQVTGGSFPLGRRGRKRVWPPS